MELRDTACYILDKAMRFVLENRLDYIKWRFIEDEETLCLSLGLNNKIVTHKFNLGSDEGFLASIWFEITPAFVDMKNKLRGGQGE